MIQLLFVISAILIGYTVFAPLLGVIQFTWIGLIFNFTLAILCVALAIILSNQGEILNKLDDLDERQRKFPRDKKACTRCDHSYDADYKSCPKCGNVDE